MNFYAEWYLLKNPRLFGESEKYLHFHEILDCHISVWELLFSRKTAIDKLAEQMERASKVDTKNIRPLNMSERLAILNDTSVGR